MHFKERIKIFQRALARYGFFASSWLLAHLPYRFVRLIMNIFLTIGFQLIIKQRRIAQESLEIAFTGEKSPREIQQIIKDCFRNLGRGMVEMLYFLAHPQAVTKKVHFEGKENLDKAMSEGKGVIAVTAHFGNFPLMMLYCAEQGYKTNAIIRPARDRKLEEFLFRRRKESGLNTIYAIPRRDCVVNSLRVLRKNELLFILLDQNFGGDGGVFVDFFGQKAATATGPVVFASRTQSPILPMFIVRQKDDTHKIIIESPLTLEHRDDEEEMIAVNISKMTKIIEKYIRKYPHEWGWMHRRWKSRPRVSAEDLQEKEAKGVPHS